MENLISVSHARKSYGGFMLDIDELVVPRGCVVGLVGGNGAGKTTTIKAIMGLIGLDAGEITLFGRRVIKGSPLIDEKRRVGVIFDTCPFPADLEVGEVARMGRAAYPNWDAKVFEDLAGKFGLGLDKVVKELSRGMGMKLQLAFALAHDPDLLILDEPTAGLDPLARAELLDLVRERMSDDRGVLISTHITSDLERIADYVTCINEGRVVFTEDIETVCDRAGVLRCRASELESVLAAGLFEPRGVCVVVGPYGVEALVPDRFALKESFPELACERATVESYMALTLKGDLR
ncbi:MAG: ABC transporter ATP-binding protein [Eggerthellaceae bacterium]|nr:ABC transporter ATP-binding protein [Eggerthellaceae bacterium]